MSKACLRRFWVIRLVCLLLGVGLSVVSESWIGLAPC